MNRAELREFLSRHLLAVEASRMAGGAPQAAVVGIVVSDELEVFFDTLEASRKAQNLRRDARISFVIGWDLEDARTAQLEGVADEPSGDDLARLKKLYFARFPDGVDRQTWPGITYFRVRPTWIRLSDFRGSEPSIEETIPIGSTWNPGPKLLETRLTGAVTGEDVRAWNDGLARAVSHVPDDMRFKLLVDLRGFDPESIEVHKAMRGVVPRLLAAHGLRPAFIDLFDEGRELPVTTTRGVVCAAFAGVHHDEVKMRDYERRIATDNQRFFTTRAEAEAWLDALS